MSDPVLAVVVAALVAAAAVLLGIAYRARLRAQFEADLAALRNFHQAGRAQSDAWAQQVGDDRFAPMPLVARGGAPDHVVASVAPHRDASLTAGMPPLPAHRPPHELAAIRTRYGSAGIVTLPPPLYVVPALPAGETAVLGDPPDIVGALRHGPLTLTQLLAVFPVTKDELYQELARLISEPASTRRVDFVTFAPGNPTYGLVLPQLEAS